MRRLNCLLPLLTLALLLASSLGLLGQQVPTPTHSTPSPKQEQTATLPTEDQIKLLVTQAERAFLVYEDTLRQETPLKGSNISIPKDREVLLGAGKDIGSIKTNPQYFNAPMGFLFVGDLDDASRNMALCYAQAAVESALDFAMGDTSAASSKQNIAQSCRDASVLLQTVSETAFRLYAQYLMANFQDGQQKSEALDKCMDTLQECASALKRRPQK